MSNARTNKPTKERTRKALFRMALASAGLTIAQWAEQHDVTQSHVSHVLNGRESKTLDEKIAAFIEAELRNVA